MTDDIKAQCYYFGCHERPGHYLWRPGMRSAECEFSSDSPAPLHYKLDTGYCPSGPEVEGVCALHHVNGWTVIAFWDRSVDTRGKCNSAFIAKGEKTFDEMIEIARANFPEVVARFSFPLIQLETQNAK